MMTLEQILQVGIDRLKAADIMDASIDAWYLMEYCFGINRATYYMEKNQVADEAASDKFRACIEKRLEHIPVSQITNQRDFYGYEFFVNEHVLTPRQETEELVEYVLKSCQGKRVLDLCTGSGCIILTLALEGNLSKAVGIDISEEALKVARRNQERLDADVTFYQSDLYEAVEGTFDIIVSNPPYIPTEDIRELMPEVRLHEPMLALDGEEDGLAFYRRIIEGAREHLAENGEVFFEIGYNQGSAVSDLLLAAGFTNVTVYKDLAGLDRVVYAKI